MQGIDELQESIPGTILLTTQKLLELAEPICAQYGKLPTKSQIKEYCKAKNIKLPEVQLRYLRNHIKEAKEKREIELLLQVLPLRPSYKDMGNALKTCGVEGATKVWFTRLKELQPELWADNEFVKQYIRLTPLDLALLDEFRTALGHDRDGTTVAILMRVLALAHYRQDINLPELVRVAKKMRDEDVQIIKKSFNLNLANL